MVCQPTNNARQDLYVSLYVYFVNTFALSWLKVHKIKKKKKKKQLAKESADKRVDFALEEHFVLK